MPSTISSTTPPASLPRFRFRPRYKGLAWCALALGAGLCALGLWHLTGGAATYSLVGGAIGAILGVLYLISPAWRVEVLAHEDALEVLSRGERRLRLPWDQVVRLVSSPSTRTCFVDGGHPDRSLLVPGLGASAPYDIENKAALYQAIVARVPADRVIEVELLETARLEPVQAVGPAEDPAQAPPGPGEEPRP